MPHIIIKHIPRITTLLIVILIIQPPFNSWEKLFLLSLSTTIVFFSEIKKLINKNDIRFLLIFFIILLLQFFFSRNYLIVNHIVLPTTVNNNFDYLKDNFSNDLNKKLKFELKKIEKEENLLKKIPQPGSNRFSTLYKVYAFQAENLWTTIEEGKYLLIEKDLDFWELGPSALNDPSLNIRNLNKPNPKNNVIFPVLFKLNFQKNNNKSDLCFTGNLYYKINDELIFLDKKKDECIKINYKTDYYFLDYKRDLKINIKNNFFYDHNNILFYILTLILLSILLLKIYKINLFHIFLSLSFFLVLYLYLKFSPNLISGFSETFYFARGNDGLVHYGFARIMANHFILGNFYDGFKGVNDIFYYMPLTRYINTILFFFFGDNILGNIFLISFFPIMIFKLINIFLDQKMSVYMTIIFLFIPIFEALGFTLINYINFTVDGYGEGFCYLFLILISYFYFNNNDKYLNYFFIGFLSFLVIGIRPNYIALLFPLIIFYIYQIFLKRKTIGGSYKKILLLVFGASFLLLMPLHNYIYGNELVLSVKTENIQNNMHIKIFDYINLIKFFFIGDSEFYNTSKIFNHLNHYIKFYEIWFMITLLNLFLAVLINKNDKLRFFSMSLIIMHSTFLLFLGDPRYSMGAWLLSFIVFINMSKEVYYPYLSNKIFSAKQ